jgi:hypothetical protein
VRVSSSVPSSRSSLRIATLSGGCAIAAGPRRG